jgi:hypothetical protein
MALNHQLVKIAQFPVPLPHIMVSNCWEVVAMENKQEHIESHEDREVQKLVKRRKRKQTGHWTTQQNSRSGNARPSELRDRSEQAS